MTSRRGFFGSIAGLVLLRKAEPEWGMVHTKVIEPYPMAVNVRDNVCVVCYTDDGDNLITRTWED